MTSENGSLLQCGSLRGHLSLVCSRNEEGRAYLSSQSFRAPVHISKPYWDGRALVVNVINPTAGLFGGDEVEVSARVETGARLILTSPSASRAHAMPSGRARVIQDFHVAEGGWLEVWPELFIPQKDCEYTQQTRVRVEKGGELFLVESVAPGRVARGESFQFRELRWALDLHYGGRLVARERARLRPDSPNVAAMRRVFPDAYFASFFCTSPKASEDHPAWREVQELHQAAVWVGLSRLGDAGRIIRLVAKDSVELSRACKAIRLSLSAIFPALACGARKL